MKKKRKRDLLRQIYQHRECCVISRVNINEQPSGKSTMKADLHHPPMRFDESPSFLNINVTASAPSCCLESRSRGNQNPNIFTSDRAR
jgi:hypothetical protein